MPTCPTCRTRYADGVDTCTADGDLLLPDQAFTGVDAELEEGRVVGEYRIEAKIGSGGFGTVYRAVHPLIGKAAAIKVLGRQYSGDPQMVARFIAEARAVNQIRHRHIIDIFAFGSLDDGRQYFVMELLEGMTLDAYLKRKGGRLAPEEALPILRAVGRALDAAHAREIAHRDLKPENVFLAMQDGEIFPKLLDFGIAKLMGTSAGSGGLKTSTGQPIGTPHYMSPEQCRGRDVDHRTDVYSFGVMAHEVLTGKLPFSGGDVMELLIKQVQAPAPPMSRVCKELSPALDEPVLAMLSKDPKKRPSTLGQAVEALFRAANSAGYAVPLAPVGGDSGARIVPPPDISTANTMAEAETLGAKPFTLQTFQGTTTESFATAPSARAKRRTLTKAMGLGVLGAAVIAGGVFAATRNGAAPASVPTAQVASAAALAPAAPPPALDPARAAPTATPEARGSDATVRVVIQSTPAGATVFRGDESLGTTPLTLPMRKGNEKATFWLKLSGHDPAPVEVEPSESRTVSVGLRERAARPRHQGPGQAQPGPGSTDIEKNPF